MSCVAFPYWCQVCYIIYMCNATAYGCVWLPCWAPDFLWTNRIPNPFGGAAHSAAAVPPAKRGVWALWHSSDFRAYHHFHMLHAAVVPVPLQQYECTRYYSSTNMMVQSIHGTCMYREDQRHEKTRPDTNRITLNSYALYHTRYMLHTSTLFNTGHSCININSTILWTHVPVW